MEFGPIKEKISRLVKQYRYVILVIIVGLVFLAIPSRKETSQEAIEPTIVCENNAEDIQEDLEKLLSNISGAGRVEVLLSYQSQEERIYQRNESSSSGQGTTNLQVDTVVITDSGHNQDGLVQKILAPTYRGAVIVCDGADDPAVALAIVEAVTSATGLSTNRISVLKMK